MERNDGMCATLVRSVDDGDLKYVSGLSAILVATIQEAKDRIAQIEFVFCNQLYPCIQSRSKHFQMVLEEAKKEVEDVWRTKEKELLNRVQNLEAEKQGMVASDVRLALEKRIVEQEEENRRLVDELVCLKRDEETAVEDKVLTEGKLRRLESNLFESNELLKEYEREKTELMCSLRVTEHTNSGLREKLEQKSRELHNERVLTAQLHSKIDSNVDQIVKHGEKLKEAENEKEILASKAMELEKKVIELRGKLDSNNNLCSDKSADKMELLAEAKKFKVLLEAYKKTRSENNYLRKKLNLTKDNMIQNREAENDGPLLESHQALSPTDKKAETSRAHATPVPLKREEPLVGNGRADEVAAFVSCHPDKNTSNQIPPKSAVMAKSSPTKASKRHGSSWINTRSHQSKSMVDPHDDFLDTPLENIKQKRSKPTLQECNHHEALIQQEAGMACSDDETQQDYPEPEHVAVQHNGKRGFKFIGTVKKKAERQTLKGVECNQCKQFYDAVLPDRGNNFTSNQDGRRCEHDEGVSRHRYRYVPPSTPEGFWNIGFESEM